MRAVFNLYRKLKRSRLNRQFKAMIAHFDEMEAEAVKAHKPVNPIRAAKREYVHRVLRSGVRV